MQNMKTRRGLRKTNSLFALPYILDFLPSNFSNSSTKHWLLSGAHLGIKVLQTIVVLSKTSHRNLGSFFNGPIKEKLIFSQSKPRLLVIKLLRNQISKLCVMKISIIDSLWIRTIGCLQRVSFFTCFPVIERSTFLNATNRYPLKFEF